MFVFGKAFKFKFEDNEVCTGIIDKQKKAPNTIWGLVKYN